MRLDLKGEEIWTRNVGAKVTVSYIEDNRWKQTPAIWLDAKTCIQLAEKLKNIASKL